MQQVIHILGGAKTGYNLHLQFKNHNIPSTFYYFKDEYGANKNGGKPVEEFVSQRVVGEVIVSSERAFVHFKKELEPRLTQHYYLRDKANIPAIAEALNVNTIGEMSLDSIIYPVFVKPKHSGEGKVPFKTKLVSNDEELSKVFKHLDDCILQHYLSPREFRQIDIGGYFTGKSSSIISFVEKNQYPIGIASYIKHYESNSIDLLKDELTKLLNSLNYRGFIEVEFKQNKFNDQYYLMDVNPRPWGCFYYYISAVNNIRDVILKGSDPEIELKKSWINLPRLVLSNLNGRFVNPSLKELMQRKISYEPLF
jgi:hypothetical protein